MSKVFLAGTAFAFASDNSGVLALTVTSDEIEPIAKSYCA
jgi:hypothetical protein